MHAPEKTKITNARGSLGLIVYHPALHRAAAEASWSALELSDIPTGPADTSGRFSSDVKAALEVGRARSRTAHTALRAKGTAYVHGRAHPPSDTTGTEPRRIRLCPISSNE